MDSVVITPADDSYSQVRYDGVRFDYGGERAGRPELPLASEWFILPDHTRIDDLVVTVTAWDTIPGRFVPQPIAGSEDGGDRPPDPQYYDSEEPYPPRVGYVAKDHYLRGYHLAQLLFYPVSFLPAESRLVVASAIDVSIAVRPTTPDEEAGILRFKRPEGGDTPTGAVRGLLAANVANPEEFDAFYPRVRPVDTGHGPSQAVQHDPFGGVPTRWPSTEGPPVQRIIITSNTTLAGEDIGDVAYWANVYAGWTTGLASMTQVYTIDEIMQNPAYASDDVEESIQRLIRDCCEEWSLIYVLLAGDLEVVPSRRLGGPDLAGEIQRLDPPADSYYVMLNADWNKDNDAWYWESDSGGVEDDISEFGGFTQAVIGRLPIRNVADAQNIFTKLIEYREPGHLLPDRTIPPATYYQSAVVAAGPTRSVDPTLDDCGYKNAEQIYGSLASHWPTDTMVRFYATLPEVWMEDCNGTDYECFESLRDYLEGAEYQDGPFDDWEGNELWEWFNWGPHIVWHLEHSDIDRLGRPSSSRL